MVTQKLDIKDQSILFYVVLAIAIITTIGMAFIAYMQYNWYPDDSTGVVNKVILATLLISIVFRIQNITVIKLNLILLSDLTLLILMFGLTNNGIAFYESIAKMGQKNAFIMCGTLLLLGVDWGNRFRLLSNSTK